MNVFDRIYKVIGENDMRVSHKKFEWSFKTGYYYYYIECIACSTLKYSIKVQSVDDIHKHFNKIYDMKYVEMIDDKVIAHNLNDRLVEKISFKVKEFLKDIKNKVPDKINLCIDDEWILIHQDKVSGTNDLEVYRKCKKIVKELSIP